MNKFKHIEKQSRLWRVLREFPVGARKFVKQSKMGLEWYWRYLAGNGVAAVINAR